MVLIETDTGFKTVTTEDANYYYVKDLDILEVVYTMGKVIRDMTFDEVRNNATLN